MASERFNEVLKGKNDLIKSMADAEVREEYTLPDIADGNYFLAVTAEIGVTEKNESPFLKFKWSIQDEGEYFGKGDAKMYWLDGDDKEKLAASYGRLGKDFKTLLGTNEIHPQDATDLQALVNEVNSRKIIVKGGIKNWESNGKKGFNVYFNKLAETITA